MTITIGLWDGLLIALNRHLRRCQGAWAINGSRSQTNNLRGFSLSTVTKQGLKVTLIRLKSDLLWYQYFRLLVVFWYHLICLFFYLYLACEIFFASCFAYYLFAIAWWCLSYHKCFYCPSEYSTFTKYVLPTIWFFLINQSLLVKSVCMLSHDHNQILHKMLTWFYMHVFYYSVIVYFANILYSLKSKFLYTNNFQ